MKKEILTHLAFFVAFSLLAILLKGWIQLNLDNGLRVGLFLLGGLLGTILPDIDHLIYIYLLRPQDLTSMRVNYMLGKKEIWQTFELLSATREERTGLIFHTAYFQIIFWILAFLVITSSGSVFGRGLVLAFALHLIVDELFDLRKLAHLDNWFRKIGFTLDRQKYLLYFFGNVVVLFLLGIIL